jgi:cephalosporin-C deacetylase
MPNIRTWVNAQPSVPFLHKPATRPADWIVRHDPVTPNASPEARALLRYLYDICGWHTMTGQHNFAAQQEVSTLAARRVSGKTPAIYGTDWGFAKSGDKDSAYVREATVKELEKQYARGSIIAITWHAVRPTDDEPVTFRRSVQGGLTDQQFHELLTPGTKLYARWCAQVDEIAGYLKELQDAHVPVLFRPYHEMNGRWFWWGGRRGEHGTKALYRQLWDRLVKHDKLTNLIWVWNVDQPTTPDRQFVDFFPGQQYVDVLSLDDYGVFQQRFYDDLNALSDGKVMAIAETANPPAASIYQDQPKWTWYMLWAGVPGSKWRRPGASPRIPLSVVVSNPRMFSLEDPGYWDAIASIRAASGLPKGSPPPLVHRVMPIFLTDSKPSGVYAVGEKIAWRVAVRGKNTASIKRAHYELKRCGMTVIGHGGLDLSSGSASIETSLDAPGSVLAVVTSTDSDGDPIRAVGGAAVAPDEIQPTAPRPEDFDQFWAAKIKQLQAIPANVQLTRADSGDGGVEYFKIRMDNINGTHIYGQLAFPKRAGKFPALLITQWAGVYGLPPERVIDRAKQGWMALNIMPHDLPFDQPQEYYYRLFQTTLKNYWTIGSENRDTSYFLRMYLSCHRATEYLAHRSDWNGQTLAVMGTSQGGQQAIMIAGLEPKITAMMAMVPSSCDVMGPKIGRAIGFPNWADQASEKHDPRIFETARYFDPVNFASRITCPALIAPGLRDETSPPTGVIAAFNQIQSHDKELLILVNSNHQGDENTQAPYNERVEQWLAALARGKPVPPG